MIIDTVLPTYNRADDLARAVESAMAAHVPAHCDVHLIIVDNNSKDHTRSVALDLIARHSSRRISYVFEPKQGRNNALNAGIAKGEGDIVSFFDDDETLDPHWYQAIADAFSDPAVDFIGGPCQPVWTFSTPNWMPQSEYRGVIGIVEFGPDVREYGSPGFHAMLNGGNSAIRRPMLERCGPYSPLYMVGEDRYMYDQLRSHGARGFYRPDMIINHYMQERRLTKAYYRRWSYEEGCQRGLMARGETISEVSFLKIPLWRWRNLINAASIVAKGFVLGQRDRPDVFTKELDLIQFWGYLRWRIDFSKQDLFIQRY